MLQIVQSPPMFPSICHFPQGSCVYWLRNWKWLVGYSLVYHRNMLHNLYKSSLCIHLCLCLLALTRSHCWTCKIMLKISQIRKRKGTRLYPRISDLFMLIFCLCLDRPFEATVKKQYADYEIIMAAVVAVLIILILSCILYLW